MASEGIVAVYTTVETVGQARALAEVVVDEHLAACANWWSISSRFRFKNRVEESGEVALLFKTTKERFPALVEQLKRHHPYALPNISAQTLEFVDSDYAAWVQTSAE